MFVDRREVRRVTAVALVTSALAWLALLARPQLMGAHVHHRGMAPYAHAIGALAPGWFFMLCAMMPPLLIAPVCYLRSRTFARRRARSVAIFVAGYVMVWAAVLPAFAAISPGHWSPAAVAALMVIALLWQCSPLRQNCLNRCHSHGEVAAFGFEADLSALRLGLTHGFWCLGSCWALMLLPMVVPSAHLAVMALADVLVLSGRFESPRLPGWHWRGPGGLVRVVLAEIRTA